MEVEVVVTGPAFDFLGGGLVRGIVESCRAGKFDGMGCLGKSSCNREIAEPSSSESSESSKAVISAALRFREGLGLLLGGIASNLGEQLWDLKHEE